MSLSLEVHDEILRNEFESRDGYVFTTAGDSFAVAFSRASDAVAAAEAVQAELERVTWPGPVLRVRIGLHLGEAQERAGDYFGPVVNLAARLESVGHGGQVLFTEQVGLAAAVGGVDLGSHHLRDVPEPVQVFQLGDGDFAPLRIVAPTRTNLPTSPSRLIGRKVELAAVRSALAEFRLVTLTAAGGTGKTRLALAVGEAELAHHPAGVWFVDLTPVTDGDLVPATVAAVVGLVLTGSDPTTQVIDYLGDLGVLLILDNCEHLVDACADFVDAFVSRAGSSRILATTREFFDVDGERAIRLSPLEAEGESSAAVELFVERALAADSSLSLVAGDRSTIAELCRHLDGSPLAIELAAARANVMSPAELLAGIGERFELLRGGRRRRSKRTLEDTLDWSYQLLDDDEQTLLRTLGVFVGTFDLAAAVSIAQLTRHGALDLIDSLIAKSLVVSGRVADGVRFRLLETTAAYAEDALDQDGRAEQVRDRHLDHYLRLCEPYDIGYWPGTLPPSVAADRDNIRAAIKWAGFRDRWEDAGRLVFSASSALQTQPEDLLSLVSDCLSHLRDADPLSTVGLHQVRIYTIVQHDIGDLESATAELEGSPDPFSNAVGVMWRAFSELHSDSAEACLSSIHDCVGPVADMPDSIVRSQLLCVGETIGGWANAYLGHDQQALENQIRAQTLLSTSAPRTTILAEVLASAGVAHVALGDTTAALVIADFLDDFQYVYFNGDEIRAITYLALEDLDSARPLIRDHAADAVTGRLSRKANNTLLLLALLTEAENDDVHTAQLLMDVEHARSPVVPLALGLADRLGIRDAFDAARKSSTQDQHASGRRAIAALRAEMTRRGWNDDPAARAA